MNEHTLILAIIIFMVVAAIIYILDAYRSRNYQPKVATYTIYVMGVISLALSAIGIITLLP